jgi:hypothetical protein
MLTPNIMLERALESGDVFFAGSLYGDESTGVYALTTTRLERPAVDLVESWLERRGDVLTYDDEVITDKQGRAHWQQPRFFGDMLTFRVLDCWVIAADEAESDPESYLEYLINDESQADTFGLDLDSLGFIRANGGESGWHDGQNDTPEKLLRDLERRLGPRDSWSGAYQYVFQIDRIGQFDMRFSLWYRPIKADEAAA